MRLLHKIPQTSFWPPRTLQSDENVRRIMYDLQNFSSSLCLVCFLIISIADSAGHLAPFRGCRLNSTMSMS